MHAITRLKRDIAFSRRRTQAGPSRNVERSEQPTTEPEAKRKIKKAQGGVQDQRPKRAFNGKAVKGTAVARGCGAILSSKRKRTKGAVSQS